MPSLRELAEYPNSFAPLGPDEERLERGRFTLCMGAEPGGNTVQRQRFGAAEVDEVLAEVRALLRARGRSTTQWEVGSRAEPPGLVELLLERGLHRDREPYAVALVLSQAPPPAPAHVEARRVRDFDEHVAAVEVQMEAFGMPPEERVQAGALRRRWQESPNLMHAAWLDGELVAAGTCAPTPQGLLLYGGATLPAARGRGAYRALIAARWREAVELGTPALLTQAGAMSLPILERLGFRRVGHVHILRDAPG